MSVRVSLLFVIETGVYANNLYKMESPPIFLTNQRQIIDSTDETDNAMLAKGIAMGVLFLASLLIGTLPFGLAHWLKWNTASPSHRVSTIISMLLAFGGGVLLATTFLHLLPEVRSTINELQNAHLLAETTFPLPEFLMCIGFFTIYFVSELVHTYINRHKMHTGKGAEAAFARGHSVRHSRMMSDKRTGSIVTVAEPDVENNNCQLEKCPEQLSEPGLNTNHHSHLHLPAPAAGEDFVASSLRGLLIVLALSVHELFEGMALGLEDTAMNVWMFFGAIASHKLVLAFCVGVELIVAKTDRRLAIAYILIFAVVSPIGIGIGMLVSQSISALITGAVLQGIATGTLVFVVFFEILKKSGTGLVQFLAVLVGFFVMFGLQQISKFFFVLGIFNLV